MDRKSWEALSELDDDSLYAILGAEPTYSQPSSSPDYLLLGLRFEKNSATIANGKKKLKSILEASRDTICQRWNAMKEKKSAFDKFEVAGLIYEVIHGYSHHDPSLAVFPAVELICRSCAYSLDSLCR